MAPAGTGRNRARRAAGESLRHLRDHRAFLAWIPPHPVAPSEAGSVAAIDRRLLLHATTSESRNGAFARHPVRAQATGRTYSARLHDAPRGCRRDPVAAGAPRPADPVSVSARAGLFAPRPESHVLVGAGAGATGAEAARAEVNAMAAKTYRWLAKYYD